MTTAHPVRAKNEETAQESEAGWLAAEARVGHGLPYVIVRFAGIPNCSHAASYVSTCLLQNILHSGLLMLQQCQLALRSPYSPAVSCCRGLLTNIVDDEGADVAVFGHADLNWHAAGNTLECPDLELVNGLMCQWKCLSPPFRAWILVRVHLMSSNRPGNFYTVRLKVSGNVGKLQLFT